MHSTIGTAVIDEKDELFVTLADLDEEARYVRVWRDGESWFSIMELEIYK